MPLKKCRLRLLCRCGSNEGLIFPGMGPHYGRLICWECGRHQKWLGRHDYQRALSKNLVNTLADIEAIASPRGNPGHINPTDEMVSPAPGKIS